MGGILLGHLLTWVSILLYLSYTYCVRRIHVLVFQGFRVSLMGYSRRCIPPRQHRGRDRRCGVRCQIRSGEAGARRWLAILGLVFSFVTLAACVILTA